MASCRNVSCRCREPCTMGLLERAASFGAMIMLTALSTSGVSLADVRHKSFPPELGGVWTPVTETCQAEGGPQITIDGSKLRGPDADCTIEYVVETAVPSGTDYSAHASCVGRANPP